MTRRPTEYQVMKRVLFAHKELNPDFNGHDVNKLIIDSVADAYARMEGVQRDWIEVNVGRLTSKCHQLSENGALELLAAIGDWMNGND